MGFPKSVISFGVLAAAASANAGILGYSGTNYLVVDASTGSRYSVMDVYVDCSGAFDKCVNYYGQNLTGKNGWVKTTKNGNTNANDAATATNGAAWVQGNGNRLDAKQQCKCKCLGFIRDHRCPWTIRSAI